MVILNGHLITFYHFKKLSRDRQTYDAMYDFSLLQWVSTSHMVPKQVKLFVMKVKISKSYESVKFGSNVGHGFIPVIAASPTISWRHVVANFAIAVGISYASGFTLVSLVIAFCALNTRHIVEHLLPLHPYVKIVVLDVALAFLLPVLGIHFFWLVALIVLIPVDFLLYFYGRDLVRKQADQMNSRFNVAFFRADA